MSDRFYESNGKMVPSGTTVLPKPYLAQWAANCAVDYIEQIWAEGESTAKIDFQPARKHFLRESTEAADYGTYIHTLCEHSLRTNTEVESPHELTQGFMEGLWAWIYKHSVKVIVMEHVVLSEWYGGRLDLVCEMDSFWMTKAWCKKFGVEWYKGIEKQRVIVLVDFKTGKGTYYETWKYQLAGYRQAYDNGECSMESCPDFEGNGNKCQSCEHTEEIQHHGVLKFNKETGKVNYKDFTVWETTRTVQDAHRLPDGKLRTEKYIRTYETDRATFNALVGLWWLQNRGVTI